MRRLFSAIARAAAIASGVLLLTSCADKTLLTSAPLSSRRVALRLTTTASAQQLQTPSWVFVAAAYDNGSDLDVLSYKFVQLTQGTQQIELQVDLGPCLASSSAKGKDSCPLMVGAALLADTTAIADSTRNLVGEAFDSALPIGPFEVVAGRTTSIPAIDLSMSRLSVLGWTPDEALRAGGGSAPAVLANNVLGELAPISAYPSAGGTTIVTAGFGPNFTNNDDAAQYASQYPQLTLFENNRWRRVSATQFPGAQLTGVTAISATDIYASSTNGLLHFDGTSFSKVAAVTDGTQHVASAVNGATTYVITGGGAGVVWIGNGQTWQRHVLPITTAVNEVCITGPNEAFAVINSGGGAVYRFDGTTWTSVPTSQPGPKIDLQCPAPGVAYVTNNGTQPPYRWNGTGWTQLPSFPLPSRQFHIGVVSPTEIYAWGDSASVDRAFMRFDGSSWNTIGRSRFVGFSSRPFAPASGGAAYVVSFNGRLTRITPSGTSTIAYQPSMRDVWVNSANSAFVVGAHSFLAHYTGGQWVADAPPGGTHSDRLLLGVWSDSPSNAWAVGRASTVYRWNGTVWNMVSDSLRPVAAGDGYNAVWGSGSTVWVVGDNTILRCSPSCANETAPGSGALLSVWGSSASNIFAVGDGGRIVRYNGSAWSAMSSPTSRTLARVSGSGANDVWAVGDSVVLHFDGSQWSSVPMTFDLRRVQNELPTPTQRANGQPSGFGLYVRGPREVYIGGLFGTLVRYDGSGWIVVSEGRYRHAVMGMHGTSSGSSCALAITESDYILPEATLYRGLGSTGCFTSPMVAPSSWP